MEERNIKISLEKAQEWYKQGGDLREVALQAFSEAELIDAFPISWNEYNMNASHKDIRINAGCIFGSVDYCHFATKEEAKAFVALGKLIQLRDEYWRLDNNWKLDLTTLETRYCIRNSQWGIIRESTLRPEILLFRTPELRDRFYENFKDLIEEAKMFL